MNMKASSLRLSKAIYWDVLNQYRNGLYLVLAVMLGFYCLIFYLIPTINWMPIMAPLLFGNLIIGTYFFVAGLVLLEKIEGSLIAVWVSPLTPGEYISAKIITLSLLAVVESCVMAFLTTGTQNNTIFLIAGIILSSAIFVMAGLICVFKYESINEFIMPSVLFTAVLQLPLISYIDSMNGPWMLIHPLYPAIIFLNAAFGSVPTWQLIYAAIYGIVSCGFILIWANRAFDRFIAEKI